MTRFIIQRLIQAFVVILFVLFTTFLLMRSMPGSPFSSERKLDPIVEERLNVKYGLQGTLMEQFQRYAWNVLHGDFGESLKNTNFSVTEILGQTLPHSLFIGTLAFILALGLGILLGTYAAVHHNETGDRWAMFLALLGICLPAFVTAPIFVLAFALWLHWLPAAGWGSASHYILPVICLAAPYAAYCARLMRNSMLDTLQNDFIRTARAKGLPEKALLFQHALKVAVLPLVSYAGPLAAQILTGSLIVEEIFKIPGLGSFFVNGILNRDVFVVGGAVTVYCTLLVLMNILVDLLYHFLDRRVKLG